MISATMKGKTQQADGSEVSWRGKYVIVWHKRQGEWKIYLDIWNRVKE
jgi:ketosteroid isomerase-like protein